MKIRLRRLATSGRVAPNPKPSRIDRGRVIPQYVLPKRRLTQMAGAFASREGKRGTRSTIRWFVQRYGVDMSEAMEPDLATYKSFNAFFTRALKPGARPLADADLVCPVDGTISQFGAIDHDRILQAKGRRYSTTTLLGGDTTLARVFHHGSFATLYLSPRDYHRIHMPCDGRLLRMVHVPGDLFSVNPTTARGVPDLFARNERVVCVFQRIRPERGGNGDAVDPGSGPALSGRTASPDAVDDADLFVIVLVGATIVGSMATVWHGVINATRGKRVREWHYADGDEAGRPILLPKGAEMGRFLLGSTVVLLFPKSPLAFNPSWEPGRVIRFGEAMAKAAST